MKSTTEKAKSELPVGVVLPIDAKWTKTPTLWDALDYKKTGKCRIFYRHICIQDKYAIQEFVWIFKKKNWNILPALVAVSVKNSLFSQFKFPRREFQGGSNHITARILDNLSDKSIIWEEKGRKQFGESLKHFQRAFSKTNNSNFENTSLIQCENDGSILWYFLQPVFQANIIWFFDYWQEGGLPGYQPFYSRSLITLQRSQQFIFYWHQKMATFEKIWLMNFQL